MRVQTHCYSSEVARRSFRAIGLLTSEDNDVGDIASVRAACWAVVLEALSEKLRSKCYLEMPRRHNSWFTLRKNSKRRPHKAALWAGHNNAMECVRAEQLLKVVK